MFAESHIPCSMTSCSESSIHWPSRARTTKSRLLDCTEHEKSTIIDTRCEGFDCGDSSQVEVPTSLDRLPTASRQPTLLVHSSTANAARDPFGQSPNSTLSVPIPTLPISSPISYDPYPCIIELILRSAKLPQSTASQDHESQLTYIFPILPSPIPSFLPSNPVRILRLIIDR